MNRLQAIRGFRDMYPQDKAVQEYIFGIFRSVAEQFGFEEYDGPIVEQVALYADKSSRELLEKQTFKVVGQDSSEDLILRPEMTPSLARMVAARAGELIFPLRYFNIGQRFRYEAPQKGRSREFYQVDFDILGSDSVIADAEIIAAAVAVFRTLGATSDDFEVCINSRRYLQEQLLARGVKEQDVPNLLAQIDRMDKGKQEIDPAVADIIKKPVEPQHDPYFKELFEVLKAYGIDGYCRIDLSVVRGLDYYTGLVFEVKDKRGDLRRSLFGAGRYDNLVGSYKSGAAISGVGFAVSDVVMIEFIKDKKLVPELTTKKSKVLVTVFEEDTMEDSVKIVTALRTNDIAAEIYPSATKKLDKQLKYADKCGIPFVVIAGPEELQKKVVKLKNLETKEQQELTVENVIKKLASYGR